MSKSQDSQEVKIERDVQLQNSNTLAIPSVAEYFCKATKMDSLVAALNWARNKKIKVNILGGGSNVILSAVLPGLTIQPLLSGKEVVFEGNDFVLMRVGAGENWHELVEHCVGNGYYGIENLALIPGLVGAAPIQNIGAYGVELSDVFHSLSAMDVCDGTVKEYTKSDCEFSYRESIFKNRLRDSRIIVSVDLKLSRKAQVNTGYPALKLALEKKSLVPSPENVMRTVVDIRKSKLPDPQVLPNAGSFFKNPVVEAERFHNLQLTFPEIVAFDLADGNKKVAAAWLIDSLGMKGMDFNGVGVHAQQALVLTNSNKLSAKHVLSLASHIQNRVQEKYGITLEIEPRMVGAQKEAGR